MKTVKMLQRLSLAASVFAASMTMAHADGDTPTSYSPSSVLYGPAPVLLLDPLLLREFEQNPISGDEILAIGFSDIIDFISTLSFTIPSNTYFNTSADGTIELGGELEILLNAITPMLTKNPKLVEIIAEFLLKVELPAKDLTEQVLGELESVLGLVLKVCGGEVEFSDGKLVEASDGANIIPTLRELITILTALGGNNPIIKELVKAEDELLLLCGLIDAMEQPDGFSTTSPIVFNFPDRALSPSYVRRMMLPAKAGESPKAVVNGCQAPAAQSGVPAQAPGPLGIATCTGEIDPATLVPGEHIQIYEVAMAFDRDHFKAEQLTKNQKELLSDIIGQKPLPTSGYLDDIDFNDPLLVSQVISKVDPNDYLVQSVDDLSIALLGQSKALIKNNFAIVPKKPLKPKTTYLVVFKAGRDGIKTQADAGANLPALPVRPHFTYNLARRGNPAIFLNNNGTSRFPSLVPDNIARQLAVQSKTIFSQEIALFDSQWAMDFPNGRRDILTSWTFTTQSVEEGLFTAIEQLDNAPTSNDPVELKRFISNGAFADVPSFGAQAGQPSPSSELFMAELVLEILSAEPTLNLADVKAEAAQAYAGVAITGVADAAVLYQGSMPLTTFLNQPGRGKQTLPVALNEQFDVLNGNRWLATPAGNPQALPKKLTRYVFEEDITLLKGTSPENSANYQVPVIASVPNPAGTCQKPAAGWPVIVFQHGITADRGNLAFIADRMAKAPHCMAMVGIDLPWHGILPTSLLENSSTPNLFYQAGDERHRNVDILNNNEGPIGFAFKPEPDGKVDPSGAHFVKLLSPVTNRDNIREAATNLHEVTQAVRAGRFTLPTDEFADAGPVFDPNTIHVVGHSLGSLVASVYLAVEGDAVDAGALLSPSSQVVELLLGSQEFGPQLLGSLTSKLGSEIGSLFSPNSLLTTALLLIEQTGITAADPMNYTLLRAEETDNPLAQRIANNLSNRSTLLMTIAGNLDLQGFEASATQNIQCAPKPKDSPVPPHLGSDEYNPSDCVVPIGVYNVADAPFPGKSAPGKSATIMVDGNAEFVVPKGAPLAGAYPLSRALGLTEIAGDNSTVNPVGSNSISAPGVLIRFAKGDHLGYLAPDNIENPLFGTTLKSPRYTGISTWIALQGQIASFLSSGGKTLTIGVNDPVRNDKLPMGPPKN